MKLKYVIKNKKKVYTLKETKETKDAHYEFIKKNSNQNKDS